MVLHRILQNISKVKFMIPRVRFSSLFANGPKATENFLYITPHVEISDMTNNQNLQKELQIRQSNYDLKKLENLWSIYEDLKMRMLQLNYKKDCVSKELMNKIQDNSNEVEKIKIELNLIKENIKKLKVPLWSAEEAAILQALRLPNRLHNLTPEKSNVIHEFKTLPSSSKYHLDIAKKLDIIHYNKNDNYYLKHDAAIFELGAQFYFSNLLKENKFVQFANPDFTKSLIVEGCGYNHTDPKSTYILHHNEDSKVCINNRLHLTGAASLFAFFAYHAKNVIYSKTLPLKYFSMGRKYVPIQKEGNNLFDVNQMTAVETFLVARNITESDDLLNEITSIIKNYYEDIGYHFRLSYVSASKLHMWESLRIAIEMYSSSLKDYIEVGNISVSEDFICKRLMFTYTEGKESKFPFIISGTLLNVPKFLACVLEQDSEFSLPHQFRVENWYSK